MTIVLDSDKNISKYISEQVILYTLFIKYQYFVTSFESWKVSLDNLKVKTLQRIQ